MPPTSAVGVSTAATRSAALAHSAWRWSESSDANFSATRTTLLTEGLELKSHSWLPDPAFRIEDAVCRGHRHDVRHGPSPKSTDGELHRVALPDRDPVSRLIRRPLSDLDAVS